MWVFVWAPGPINICMGECWFIAVDLSDDAAETMTIGRGIDVGGGGQGRPWSLW